MLAKYCQILRKENMQLQMKLKQRGGSDLTGKYMMVNVWHCTIGFPHDAVKELISTNMSPFKKIDPIDGCSACVKGMVDLRSFKVPIVDLGLALGLRAVTSEDPVVIITAVRHNRRRIMVGFMVDAILDNLVTFCAEDILLPKLRHERRWVAGTVGQFGRQLLNLDKILSVSDFNTLAVQWPF
jgi:chemotaxis signal transduction protein